MLWTERENVRSRRAKRKPFVHKQLRQSRRAIGFVPRYAPGRNHMLAETLLHWQSREEPPSFVVPIFVENRQTPFRHDTRQLSNQQGGIANKGNHPAAPGEIVICRGQIVSHQIDLVNFNVRERSLAAGCLHRTNEVSGTFKRDYFARRSDNLGKIDSRVTGTRAHVEYTFADCNAGSL